VSSTSGSMLYGFLDEAEWCFTILPLNKLIIKTSIDISVFLLHPILWDWLHNTLSHPNSLVRYDRISQVILSYIVMNWHMLRVIINFVAVFVWVRFNTTNSTNWQDTSKSIRAALNWSCIDIVIFFVCCGVIVQYCLSFWKFKTRLPFFVVDTAAHLLLSFRLIAKSMRIIKNLDVYLVGRCTNVSCSQGAIIAVMTIELRLSRLRLRNHSTRLLALIQAEFKVH